MIPAKKQTSHLSTFISALSASKLREVESIKEEIKSLYRLALVTAGHTGFDVEMVKAQSAILEKALRRDYNGLTLAELQLIVERGATGQYGVFHGISPKTFIDWIKAYQNSHERKEALREIKQMKQLEYKPKELTKEQKLEFWEQSKAEFLQKGTLNGEIYLYKIGCEFGLIDLQDEFFIEEVKFKALKWFEAEKLRIIEKNGLTQKAVINLINNVLKADEETRSTLAMWKNRCRRIAVELTMKGNG